MSEEVSDETKSPPLRLTQDVWLSFALFAVTLVAYWPSLRGGLLWDDDAHVTRPALQSITGLWRIWFDLGATQQYYPVLHSAFWLEHHIWGDSVVGYHLLNVALHSAAACLFALILSKLSIKGAWVGAFIFALHPVSVESVAWISEQKNTLSAIFYLSALLVYLQYDEETSEGSPPFGRRYFVALALFGAAILSKSVTATLPAALLVIIWWKRGTLSWKRDVFPLLPWFGIGIVGGLFTAWVERRYVGAAGKDFSLTTVQRGLIAGRDAWFYLGKLVWPSNLMFVYPRWMVNPAVWWQYLFPAGMIAIVAAAWLIRKRTRGPLAALLFFLGSLFPALGFFNAYPFIYSFVADHFQYIASLGIIALASAFFNDKWRTVLAVVPIGILATLTWMNASTYRDSERLYRATILRNPDCWMCYNNLGLLMYNQNRLGDARDLFLTALQIKPDCAEAHNNIGTLLNIQHRIPEAKAKFELALQIKPDYADAENNLGNVLIAAEHPQEAMPHLQKALQLKPDYPEAKFNLAAALLKGDRVADAITNLKDAIRLKPTYVEAHALLGVAWYVSGQLVQAKGELEEAVRLNPNYVPPHRDLGETLWELGQVDGAITQFETALRFNPADNEVRQSLAKVYAAKGRSEDAAALYEELLRQKPDRPDAHNGLALVLQTLKRPQEALAHFQEAVRLKPDYGEAHYNLGLLLISLGRNAESIAEFKSALRDAPNNAEAHDALGAALYQSGHFKEALAEFTETQRLNPQLAGVQDNLELARRAAVSGRQQ